MPAAPDAGVPDVMPPAASAQPASSASPAAAADAARSATAAPHAPDSRARLPSLDRLLRLPPAAALIARHGRTLVVDRARALLAALRIRVADGTLPAGALGDDALCDALAADCAARMASGLRSVLNLTGTVIHSNLGRALLADEAIEQVVRAGRTPVDLEYDLEAGGRGDRDALVERLLCELTGAQAATVVNNNAAAVLLTAAALARGREVLVSRGELVEIGGAFRIPDVMRSAGARLVEVGTTNRTHADDYAAAIGPRTGLIMKVHPSNFSIEGFSAQVDERALAEIAHRAGLPLACDLGSGALVDLSGHGLPREPIVGEAIAAGCDVVTFSGDKLLGGPQAGLIVGTAAAIGRIRRHPLKRALRVSKLPLAALEATLRLYRSPERLAQRLPVLRLLTRAEPEIRALAEAIRPPLAAALAPHFGVEVVALASQIGSGSLPVDRLASAGLAITPTGRRGTGIDSALSALARTLRALPVPVLGRISARRLLLDLRCLEDPAPLLAQLAPLAQALRR
jgi:L-seryl-tRNA(Ser) seleniumtransferase